MDMNLRSGCQLEVEASTACFGSEDKFEGMSAFMEKRKAEWKNK